METTIEQINKAPLSTWLDIVPIAISIVSIIIAASCAWFTIRMQAARKRTELILKLYDTQRVITLYKEKTLEFEKISKDCKLKPDNELVKQAEKLEERIKKQYESLKNSKYNLDPIKIEHLIPDIHILLSDMDDMSKRLASVINGCKSCDDRQTIK